MHTLTEVGTLGFAGFLASALVGALAVWVFATAARNRNDSQMENPP